MMFLLVRDVRNRNEQQKNQEYLGTKKKCVKIYFSVSILDLLAIVKGIRGTCLTFTVCVQRFRKPAFV